MSYRTKKEVLSSLKARTRTVSGAEYTTYEAYLGRDPITKKPRRIYDPEPKALKEKVAEFFARLGAGGALAAQLTPEQAEDARNALLRLSQYGMHGTLTECVERLHGAGIRLAGDATDGVTLRTAFREYLAKFSGEQTHHRRTVASRVGRWLLFFGSARAPGEVTTREVCQYLRLRYGESPKTYNNHLTYIRSFLGWCAKSERRYLSGNPLADAELMQIAYREPATLSAADTERMFRVLEDSPHSHLLAYAVLSFLCGVRREEILRLATVEGAGSVDLENGTVWIRMPKGYLKGIEPRAFEPEPNALAWMRSFDFHAALARLNEDSLERFVPLLREHGIAYPRNAGRHSFISYHVAAYGDMAKTEYICGTSRAMLVHHYKSLKTKAEGEAYFRIMPTIEKAAGEGENA